MHLVTLAIFIKSDHSQVWTLWTKFLLSLTIVRRVDKIKIVLIPMPNNSLYAALKRQPLELAKLKVTISQELSIIDEHFWCAIARIWQWRHPAVFAVCRLYPTYKVMKNLAPTPNMFLSLTHYPSTAFLEFLFRNVLYCSFWHSDVVAADNLANKWQHCLLKSVKLKLRKGIFFTLFMKKWSSLWHVFLFPRKRWTMEHFSCH